MDYEDVGNYLCRLLYAVYQMGNNNATQLENTIHTQIQVNCVYTTINSNSNNHCVKKKYAFYIIVYCNRE